MTVMATNQSHRLQDTVEALANRLLQTVGHLPGFEVTRLVCLLRRGTEANAVEVLVQYSLDIPGLA